ncbi:MAG: ribonuclease E/G, partial [Cyanobacteria bacterium J06626_26]
VDVNSGSFTRSATARETVLWTNCEAAIEIARQLRLRNVAGVIVVDFIDMESRRDQMQVLEHFGKALQSDKSRPQISQLSELGLVELTRKRQGQNIYELFGRPCHACGGLGHLVQLPGEAPVEVQQSAVTSRVVSLPSARVARQERSSEGLEPAQSLKSLDLVNHPDYQDKGNGRNRRRRRRGNEAPSTRGGRPAAAPPKLANNGSSVSPIIGSTPVLPSESSREEQQLPMESAPARGKRTRGRGRKPETPPQVITVALTPDEQRIYAEMGISPLVMSQEEIKDTKNVLVSVVAPGEVSEVASVNLPDSESFEDNQNPEPEEEVDTVSLDEVEPTAAVNAVEADNQADVPAAEATSPQEESVESEPDEEPTTRRRRRRRSSATAG